VEIVEAVTQETTKALPIFMGLFVTMLILFVRTIVQLYWTTPKEQMKKYGESPEGNALQRPQEELVTGYFPFLPKLSRDLVARVTRNLEEAESLAHGSAIL